MLREIWRLLKGGVEAFIEDDALSRGAAIAFYVITAFAPVLYIAAAIAGAVFGWEASTSALRAEISRLVGPEGADFVLVATLFAAIYKVLPDVALEWRDVIAGAIGTAVLFDIGEYLIALYLGSGFAVGRRYGAAGGLLLLLLWIYYTTQVFLLGAEF